MGGSKGTFNKVGGGKVGFYYIETYKVAVCDDNMNPIKETTFSELQDIVRGKYFIKCGGHSNWLVYKRAFSRCDATPVGSKHELTNLLLCTTHIRYSLVACDSLEGEALLFRTGTAIVTMPTWEPILRHGRRMAVFDCLERYPAGG